MSYSNIHNQLYQVNSKIEQSKVEAKDYYLKRLPRRLLLADQKVDKLSIELHTAKQYLEELMIDNQNNSYVDSSRVCTIPENIETQTCKIDYVEKGECGCGCYEIINYRWEPEFGRFDGRWLPQSPQYVMCPSCKLDNLLNVQSTLLRIQQNENQKNLIKTQQRIEVLKQRISNQTEATELKNLEDSIRN